MGVETLKPLNPGEFVVLLYHGVHSDDLELNGRNSSGKHVPAAVFRKHMEIIASGWNLVTMSDIARAYRGVARLPDRAVAVTVDDGFANVYHHGWPILRELGLTATFYLTTGFVGTGRMSWTDRLEGMILGARPQRLHVRIAGKGLDFALGDIDSRVAALTRIKAGCKKVSFTEMNAVLSRIQEDLNTAPDPSHPLYEMLQWDQVREMARGGAFEFGAHTVDHIPLSRMPYEEMTRQVSDSLAAISRELGTST